MKKKLSLLLSFCLLTSTFMFGCSKPEPTPVETTESEQTLTSVVDYAYTEETKTSLYFESNPDNIFDISDHVTNYSSGDLFLTLEGYELAFNLAKSDPTDEDIRLFEQYEKENEFEGTVGNILKISNNNHTVLFRENSSLYLADGVVKTFTYPPITKDDKISLPLFDIAFSLGYSSVGTTIGANNSLIYTIDDFSVALEESLAAETEESTEALDETINIDENTTDSTESAIDDLLLDVDSETLENTEAVTETESKN